ncbi:hypothetical protein BSK33_16960, partial [Geobacillus sp. 44B]
FVNFYIGMSFGFSVRADELPHFEHIPFFRLFFKFLVFSWQEDTRTSCFVNFYIGMSFGFSVRADELPHFEHIPFFRLFFKFLVFSWQEDTRTSFIEH